MLPSVLALSDDAIMLFRRLGRGGRRLGALRSVLAIEEFVIDPLLKNLGILPFPS